MAAAAGSFLRQVTHAVLKSTVVVVLSDPKENACCELPTSYSRGTLGRRYEVGAREQPGSQAVGSKQRPSNALPQRLLRGSTFVGVRHGFSDLQEAKAKAKAQGVSTASLGGEQIIMAPPSSAASAAFCKRLFACFAGADRIRFVVVPPPSPKKPQANMFLVEREAAKTPSCSPLA